MENVALIETGALVVLISGFTQLITRWILPKANKMQVTLVVSAVITAIGFVSFEAIGYLEVILAIFGQVFGYDVATKTFQTNDRFKIK